MAITSMQTATAGSVANLVPVVKALLLLRDSPMVVW